MIKGFPTNIDGMGGVKNILEGLRREGVECIDVDFSENAKCCAGGPACITMRCY